MAKKKVQTFCKEIVDTSTGEVLTFENQKVYTETIDSEHFYMTYLEYIAPLYELKSGIALLVLTWLCEHAQFNTGKVDIPAARREELCSKLGICNNALTNNLKKLKSLNLISGEKGSYQINPQIFWKGDAKSRNDLLEGKEFKVSFEIV